MKKLPYVLNAIIWLTLALIFCLLIVLLTPILLPLFIIALVIKFIITDVLPEVFRDNVHDDMELIKKRVEDGAAILSRIDFGELDEHERKLSE